MTRIESSAILALSAIGDGDHEGARETLNDLTVAQLRQVVALTGMLSYLANQTIDDKPRDLEDELRHSRQFRLVKERRHDEA
jgi:predicted nucleic acid-binding protein